jgi:PilZ domain
MDKRPESRIEAQILVRVWGMDADGRPFFQNANAGKISSEGAQISGIAHPLKAGDIIGVQYGDKKARFKVIWVIDAGVARKIEAGVQMLPNQRSPWQDLAAWEKKEVISGENKRRFVRHKVLFPIEISFDDGRRSQMNTNATDIGGRGCYVESLLPLALGTKVNIKFWMDDEKVQTSGVVRASDPGVGMGIEFTALDNTVQERLQLHLDKLDDGLASRDAAAKSATNSEG